MSDDQVYEWWFHASPERVWAAITDPADTERYFFGTRVSVGERQLSYTAGGAPLVEGEVLEREPNRRLVTTWRIHYDPACAGETSQVTWALEPRGPVTKLTLTHALAGAPNTARNVGSDGWSVVLSGMKTLIETGRPLPPMG